MRLLLPSEVAERVTGALRDAEHREVGGVLMGEYVAHGVFCVRDLTVQRHGTFASFVREVGVALGPLRRFFRETGHDYTRYNYLGEWHSHPSFATEPSCRDAESMWRIVEDPAVGANFAVLLIVRLGDEGKLKGSAAAYPPGRRKLAVSLEADISNESLP